MRRAKPSQWPVSSMNEEIMNPSWNENSGELAERDCKLSAVFASTSMPYVHCGKKSASQARGTRSAGVYFSAMRNRRKNRLGRSPLRTSLGYGAGSASSYFSARLSGCGPVSATIPGHLGQLALWLGGFPVRAYLGEAAFPPPGAWPSAAGNSCDTR